MVNNYLINNVEVFDGSGSDAFIASILIKNGIIANIFNLTDGSNYEQANHQNNNQVYNDNNTTIINGANLSIAPGFIDTHTHDDLIVIKDPDMLAKISQGVTTVIVGNCGISAVCVANQNIVDPMGLLGEPEEFIFQDLQSYIDAINKITPSVNVASLIGHTSLRNNHLTNLSKEATHKEIDAMRQQLNVAMENGAIGLSTGLAYHNAINASTDEVISIINKLYQYNGIYVTHLRNETDDIIDAIHEAILIGTSANIPIIISHLKCAGKNNWGRSQEILKIINKFAVTNNIGYDCYPYEASSSLLDFKQVTTDFPIKITWVKKYPEINNLTLTQIATLWDTDIFSVAKKIEPAGAIYFNMDSNDVENIIANKIAMIGSDGLPCDPTPHPRLWGSFPRFLSHYCLKKQLFSLSEAIYKITGLAAKKFALDDKRGFIKIGWNADLVLFDKLTIKDNASFTDPKQISSGIKGVWVGGICSFYDGKLTGARNGKFIKHNH